MSRYLEKHTLYPPLFPLPDQPSDLILVIPSYNEPDIIPTLDSLLKCKIPSSIVEIIIVINHSTTDALNIKEQNKITSDEIIDFQRFNKPWFNLLQKVIELSPKHSGVGLARKIGMDEALRRLTPEGIILCLDADCTVAENYFIAVESHFKKSPKSIGASIYFEHPLSGSLPLKYYDAIVQYELHLRYYVHMQRRLSLPYAFHTVGSSMAVTAKAYEAVGGMNKRKAGEDFYFIQKLIKHGPFTICNSTTVFPSPRISDRVPFGTGKAINDLLQADSSTYLTYPPQAFQVVGDFITWCLSFYENAEQENVELITRWKTLNDIEIILKEIKSNTSDFQSFKKRFFKWFDGFQLMKLLHYLRDAGYSLIPVETSIKSVFPKLKDQDSRSLLAHYRKMDHSL